VIIHVASLLIISYETKNSCANGMGSGNCRNKNYYSGNSTKLIRRLFYDNSETFSDSKMIDTVTCIFYKAL
jgi:hypothetical protein